jgi:DNA repair exonuclease SbcCD nuclease subunit
MMRVMPPSRPLRVLHTADVHLESDYGAEPRAKARRIFSRIVDRALADEVDLVLIAGDLFDHNRVGDEAAAFVRAELARLRQPVVIMPGNHDALYPTAVFDRYDFTAGTRHVHVIRAMQGETVAFPGLDAVVWGRAMAEHEREFQPLGGIPARPGGAWSLGMAHGFYYPEREQPERSSPIFGDEIAATGWDYIAMGHQHVQTDVSQGGVAAWYAGAPGTVLRIDLSAGGVRVEPRPLE